MTSKGGVFFFSKVLYHIVDASKVIYVVKIKEKNLDRSACAESVGERFCFSFLFRPPLVLTALQKEDARDDEDDTASGDTDDDESGARWTTTTAKNQYYYGGGSDAPTTSDGEREWKHV